MEKKAINMRCNIQAKRTKFESEVEHISEILLIVSLHKAIEKIAFDQPDDIFW